MDASMIKGMAVGGLAMVVLGAGAMGGYQQLTKPKTAEVVAVKEVMETVVTPRERCQDVAVRRQAPVADQHRIAGTVIGGLAGGLLGSTVGNGSGKTLATVAALPRAVTPATRCRRTCSKTTPSLRWSDAVRWSTRRPGSSAATT